MKKPRKQSEEEKQFEKWWARREKERHAFLGQKSKVWARRGWLSALKWFRLVHCSGCSGRA